MASSLSEQIEELNRRIALLGRVFLSICISIDFFLNLTDGDKKAYAENSQWTIKQNKSLINQLRSDNKLLRSKFSKRMKADDDVITEVFRANKLNPPADLRGLNGDIAVQRFDQTVCELIKRRNALQHVRQSHEHMLASLEAEYQQMKNDVECIYSSPIGETEEDKTFRQLENRLDKAIIKNNEAKHIKKTYEAIIQKLSDVRIRVLASSKIGHLTSVAFMLFIGAARF